MHMAHWESGGFKGGQALRRILAADPNPRLHSHLTSQDELRQFWPAVKAKCDLTGKPAVHVQECW